MSQRFSRRGADSREEASFGAAAYAAFFFAAAFFRFAQEPLGWQPAGRDTIALACVRKS
jgi:hypothetical protein